MTVGSMLLWGLLVKIRDRMIKTALLASGNFTSVYVFAGCYFSLNPSSATFSHL